MATTRVNEANYDRRVLLPRLVAAVTGAPAYRHFRADRRQYLRSWDIQITNNTRASLLEYIPDLDGSTAHRKYTAPVAPGTALSATLAADNPNLVVRVTLHGHEIALLRSDGVELSLAHGWRTATTNQRISQVLRDNTSGVQFGTRNGCRGNRDWDAYLWSTSGASRSESTVWLYNHPGATIRNGVADLPVMDEPPYRVFVPNTYISPSNQPVQEAN